MRVLVTGGCGYIGSHVVYALLDAGHEPFVLDDLSTGHQRLIPSDVPLWITDLRFVDPLDLKTYLEDNGIEAVMHFAGSIVVPESVEQPLVYWKNNVVASHNLINAMVGTGLTKLVFSSTAAVYGDPYGGDENTLIRPLREHDDLLPINPYGDSKLAVEKLIQACHTAYGIDYGILRYFNVAGADPKGRTGQISPKSTHLIKLACEAMVGEKRRSLSIAGTDYPTPDGSCIRDYIHVSDLAQAHVDVLHYIADGRTITANVGYGRGFSVREVLETAQKIKHFEITEGPRRDGDPAILVADTREIRHIVGWTPEHDDLQHIITTAYLWEKQLSTK
jgi:UDP-glucose 4-epimerase